MEANPATGTEQQREAGMRVPSRSGMLHQIDRLERHHSSCVCGWLLPAVTIPQDLG